MRWFFVVILASCAGAYWNDYTPPTSLRSIPDNRLWATITDNRIQRKAVKSQIQNIITTQRATEDPDESTALEQQLIDLIILKDTLNHEHFDLVRKELRPS